MNLSRVRVASSGRLASLALVTAMASIVLLASGCTSGGRTTAPGSASSTIQVVGTLVAVRDERPVDGGVDLTLQVATDARDLVRVPSVFRKPPVESIVAMHAVVDLAKVGDRIQVRGKRDESGALLAESLKILPR